MPFLATPPLYAVVPIRWKNSDEWRMRDPSAYFPDEITAFRFATKFFSGDFFRIIAPDLKVLHERTPTTGTECEPENCGWLPIKLRDLIAEVGADEDKSRNEQIEKLKLELDAHISCLKVMKEKLRDWMKHITKINGIAPIDEEGSKLFLECLLLEKIIETKSSEVAKLESQI